MSMVRCWIIVYITYIDFYAIVCYCFEMIRKTLKKLIKYPLETIGLVLVLSFLCVSVLDAFGAVDLRTSASLEKFATKRQEQIVEAEKRQGIVPLRVVIDDVGIDTQIQNPDTTDVAVLDEELRSGAVHYPGSGIPGNGNMFLFGHSSSLAVVRNQAYKTFNGIQNLERGDEIVVYSEDEKFIYRVLNVKMVSAEEALVDFSSSKDMLTLSTCNTFGQKQDRFVVEADYVRSEVI